MLAILALSVIMLFFFLMLAMCASKILSLEIRMDINEKRIGTIEGSEKNRPNM